MMFIIAFLFAVAGIVEPTSGGSAAVALFTFIGFAIVTYQDHKDWSAGYAAGSYDSSVSRLNAKQEEDWDAHLYSAQTLYKCGQQGCTCVSDSRYAEWRQAQ